LGLIARSARCALAGDDSFPFDIADATFDALKLPRAADWEALYFRAVQRLAPEFAGALEVIAAATTPVVFGCWVGRSSAR